MNQEESIQAHDSFGEKLRDFYQSTLANHKVSFWASIVASGIGFLAVILALIAYLASPGNLNESVVLAIAGVVAQFISAAFFYLHNMSTLQVLSGFESPVKRQDTQLAVSLVTRMNEKSHDYMYMNIINVLMVRNEPNRDLSPELVRAFRESGKA